MAQWVRFTVRALVASMALILFGQVRLAPSKALERGVRDADRIARSFFKKVGIARIAGPTREDRGRNIFGAGYWSLNYDIGGKPGLTCIVRDSPDVVGTVLTYRAAAREMHAGEVHEQTTADEGAAQAALVRLWSALGFRYPCRLAGFRYKRDTMTLYHPRIAPKETYRFLNAGGSPAPSSF